MKKEWELLGSAPLFAGLERQELEQLLLCLKPREASYARDDYLLRAGESIAAVGLLLAGKALVVQEDFWGNRSILSALAPGQCFGESFACVPGTPVNVSVVACEPVQALYLDAGRLLTACWGGCTCPCHGRVIRNLLTDLAGKNLRLNQKVTHLGQRTTRARLLSYLSAQARQHGGPKFDIPFSRQQLADYLCVDRSGLSQELCRLRDEGLLLFSKNHFQLLE